MRAKACTFRPFPTLPGSLPKRTSDGQSWLPATKDCPLHCLAFTSTAAPKKSRASPHGLHHSPIIVWGWAGSYLGLLSILCLLPGNSQWPKRATADQTQHSQPAVPAGCSSFNPGGRRGILEGRPPLTMSLGSCSGNRDHHHKIYLFTNIFTHKYISDHINRRDMYGRMYVCVRMYVHMYIYMNIHICVYLWT